MTAPRPPEESEGRRAAQLRVVADVMAAFIAATDQAQVLPTIVAKAAEALKAFGAVLLIADDGHALMTAATFDADPAALQRARAALEGSLSVTNQMVPGHALADAVPIFVPRLTFGPPDPESPPGCLLQVLRDLGAHSLILLPCRARGGAIGHLMLARHRADRAAFDEADLSLAQILASQVALAVVHAGLLESTAAALRPDARFRALLESAPDAMVIVGMDGNITLANNQVQTVFGYAPADLIGQPIECLIPERFRSAHPAHRAGYLQAPGFRAMGAGVELFGRRRDGREFPVEVSLSPVKTDEGMLVAAAVRDISERKKAEQQQTRLAAIVNSSDDAIISKTLEGTITTWNHGAECMFGYSADEIIGTSISRLVPPDRAEEERSILEGLAHGDSRRFDTVRRRKDGSDIDVSVTISPLRDSTGRVVGISKVARDITERKRFEENLARAKNDAEAATRELEAFSYSVAHDLRAPLRGMSGFAQVLVEDYAEKLDHDGRDCLREIQSNAAKMGSLIDSLLSLSRVTRSDWRPERVDLSALAREVAAECAAENRQRELKLVVEDHLWATVDARLARALFSNLIGNAWKFTAHVPVACIQFGAVENDGQLAFFVGDNGAGFDMAYAGKLFSPFQRLHSNAEFPGTGIGLATAQRIVHRHGGRIWAEAKVGEGATFSFTLPGAERASPPRRVVSPPAMRSTT